jgi:hypothetical protein
MTNFTIDMSFGFTGVPILAGIGCNISDGAIDGAFVSKDQVIIDGATDGTGTLNML